MTNLTLSQLLDHELSAAEIDHFVEQRRSRYQITLADGVVELSGAWLLYNWPWWRVLWQHGLAIETRHLLINRLPNKQTQQHIQDLIMEDVSRAKPEARYQLGYALMGAVNWLYNVYVNHLGRFHLTIDGFRIAQTLAEPAVAAAISLDVAAAEQVGIQAVEEVLKSTNERALGVLRDPATPNNIFFPYLALDAVSPVQLPQVVVAGGTRTDVNDLMITKAILSSYMDGFADISEYIIDARSAMKSVFYNAYGMPNSQYTNRKMQLQASVMQYIYDGDCGSTVTVGFHITPSNAKNVVGKIIRLSDGTLLELTRHNITQFHNQTVQLRSVFTCRHTDGFCRTCGGRLTDAMHPGVIPGFACVIELMGPVAQLILSNKHVARTYSENYRVPEMLRPWMRSLRNEVYLRQKLPHRIAIRIPFANMERVRDVQYIEDDRAINDQQFSAITSLQFFDPETGERLSGELLTMNPQLERDKKKAVNLPYFSSDVLRYLRDHPDAVHITDKLIEIDLSQFDSSRPLFRCIVGNDSMMRFCKRVENMFTTEIRRYTSIPEVLRDFTTHVWSKVSPNLLHIEVALRANLVTSGHDYRIPVVEDVNHVRFDSLGRVIPQRSIGAVFAFEQIGAYLSHPRAYTHPKPIGVFDYPLGFKD